MSCDRTRLGKEIEDSKIQFKCEASCIPKSHYHLIAHVHLCTIFLIINSPSMGLTYHNLSNFISLPKLKELQKKHEM
jgi:hypothetical protein